MRLMPTTFRALRLASAVILTPALLVPPAHAALQDPLAIHFVASGDYVFSSARITVDGRLGEGDRLQVALIAPSGRSESLRLDRDGNRFSWTGQLTEAGEWRAEATASGARARRTASATVLLEEGAPTCSLTISAPEQPTHYLDAELIADSCAATAITGNIAARYVTVLQNGVQIASMDASQQCERRFILPGGGAYEATLTVADNRGVTATCSSADVGVDALYPGYWPIADFATGIYSSERPDIADASGTAWLSGAGFGLTVPRDAAAEETSAFSVRAGGGFAHNYWVGSSVDVLMTRQTPGGFFGAGAGLWGIGDTDILDGGVFGTAGLNLPSYTGAGQVQGFVELRLFARHISAPQDNFSSIVGVRFNFKRTHELLAR